MICPRCHGYRRAAVEIGNARGRIALYLDETEAIDLAHHYGPGDAAYEELMAAIERAYPQPLDAALTRLEDE